MSSAYSTDRYGIAPGPERWERAARHAALHPTDKRAQRFFERVAASRAVQKRLDDAGWFDGPRQIQAGSKRQWTCGTEHAARQLALVMGTTAVSTLAAALCAPPLSEVAAPSRRTRCVVCGCKINTDGSLSQPAQPLRVYAEQWADEIGKAIGQIVAEQPASNRRTYVVNEHGALVPLSGPVRVVDLTDSEYEIAKLLERDGVAELLRTRGRALAGA